MKKRVTRYCLIAFALCLFLAGHAQSLDQAKKLYNNKEYEAAKPAFERLVLQSPNNSSYNLWYGVCCYETGEVAIAEKHLLIANKRKVVDSYRYLAEIYRETYRFDQSVEMWEHYITLMKKKKEKTELFEEALTLVKKMQRMKEHTEQVQIIDSIVILKEQLLSTYFLNEECGTLYAFRDFFVTSEKEASTVYVNSRGDQAYYAKRTASGLYKLFTQSKLMNDWTDEMPLFADDSMDYNYPFMLGDGVTLYFASKGNGAIGGYDLFVTRYSTANNAYLVPEQLGMPFNSQANDYFMIIDEMKGVGWFASDRNQPEGKVCVYLFIPENRYERVAEDVEDELRSRLASIASIRETWVSAKDYSALIDAARIDGSATRETIRKDFEFVISDKVVYYTLREIQNEQARTTYEKVLELKRQLSDGRKQLETMRESYIKGDGTEKSRLGASIRQAEIKQQELYDRIAMEEKKSRNAEVEFLNNR